MKTKKNNRKGFSVFGIFVAILILSLASFAVLYTTVVGEIAKVDEWVKGQAFYVAQAGAEYAMKKIYASTSPAVAEPGKSFASGTFIITYASPLVTVTGRVGNAKHILQFDEPDQADCVTFNTASANLDGNDKIHHIYFTKTCLTQIVIDKITLSWNPDTGQKCKKVRIENTYVYNDPTGLGSGSLFELSDYTVSTASQQDFSKIEFDSNINTSPLTQFTLTVHFGDGSQTSAMTFTPP